MRNRSLAQIWKAALAVISLTAMAMAVYVQLFELQARKEEDRLSAARLEQALAESRVRLRQEIVAELRAGQEGGSMDAGDAEEEGARPLPGVVLRRGESGAGSSLRQVLDSQESQEAAMTRLQESLDSLASRMEQSDQALRQDLEKLRAQVRREQETSSKTLSLLLAALIPLVIHFLTSLWPAGRSGRGGRDEPGRDL